MYNYSPRVDSGLA